MNIRDTIVADRVKRIQSEGHTLGVELPRERKAPVLPFGQPPGVICEVKRRSPSKGDISPGLDPLKQVSYYALQGVRSVSVLTEESYFAGSLKDLMRIKQAYPKVAVLRKDFLVDLEDVEVSYRAGADAILLIASILDQSSLQQMHKRAEELGMAALVELHDEEDIDKARALAPPFVGINSRNLATFTVDPIHPIALKARLTWPAKLVYESGIQSEEDARFAAGSGFDCVLVGEAVVRKPQLARELINGLTMGGGSFWADLFARRGGLPTATGRLAFHRPLVKICGLANATDVETAIELGADALGFIFAPSPRRADARLFRDLGKRAPDEPVRVGVVVSDDAADPGKEAFELFAEGLLDAIQFHGDEESAECYRRAFPYYKALGLSDIRQAEKIGRYSCPRVLVDAQAAGAVAGGTDVRGGSGVRLPAHIVAEAAKLRPLWLAGGLHPENIAEVARGFKPELVDVSSGVESAPGVKDHDRLRRFFDELRKV